MPLLAAQAQYYRYGAKAGGGFSTAVGKDVSSDQINHLAGIHAGLVFTYEFVSRLGVQAELNYARKGFVYDNYRRENDATIPPGTALAGDSRLDYIELPLLVKVQKAALFLEAGPYLGYLLNVSSDVNLVETVLTDPPAVLEPRNFSREAFNSFDVGYAVGGGLMLQNGFFMSIRNTGSLRPFPKEDLKQRNLAWQLSIGYLVPARGSSPY